MLQSGIGCWNHRCGKVTWVETSTSLNQDSKVLLQWLQKQGENTCTDLAWSANWQNNLLTWCYNLLTCFITAFPLGWWQPLTLPQSKTECFTGGIWRLATPTVNNKQLWLWTISASVFVQPTLWIDGVSTPQTKAEFVTFCLWGVKCDNVTNMAGTKEHVFSGI